MYFNVNFNVFFKLIKVHLLVSELYIIRLHGARIKKNNQLRLFRETTALCRQKHKYMNGGGKVILIKINITAGGLYIFHWDFSG